MALKHRRKMAYKREAVAIEHTGFYVYVQRYVETMRVRNYSDSTLHRRENAIRSFVGWCDERGLDTPQAITKPILERYQKYLYYYRQATGEPLSSGSRTHYITAVRQLFKWLTQENYLLYNPASELIAPRSVPGLPVVLSVEEVEALMLQPSLTTPNGVRDRAILEVLYSTGVRRTELCNLQLHNLSLSRHTLYVRKGKGGKDRLLPVGARAVYWLSRYLNDVRPQLMVDINDTSVFLNDYGEGFRDSKLSDKVKRYMKKAGISAPGSCHLLRHAMATHMLENGAEIRFIQAMLGHTHLSTTQVYTHVSIRKLQEIHAATHPAKVEERAELLSSLAAEDAEQED